MVFLKSHYEPNLGRQYGEGGKKPVRHWFPEPVGTTRSIQAMLFCIAA